MAATVPQNTGRLPGPLVLALWLALASGVIEGSFRLFQVFGLHKVILMPLHVIWMAPVADLVWIGIPALLLILLKRLWPRLFTPGLILGVLGTIAFLPLVLLYTSMHRAVALFLAIALAVQLTRIVLARPTGFARLVHRTMLPLLLIPLIGGLAISGLRAYREHHVLSAAPAARPGMPNVLLIIWDTVRGQNLSVYGYDRPTTPFLEAFAKEGVKFDRAISTAPWTLPSHGAMFTGHRPRDLMRSIYHPLVDTFPTLAGVLTDHGYVTGGFVANMAYTTREHGLDRGFSHYKDYTLGWGNIVLASRLGRVVSDMPRFRRAWGNWNQLNRKNAAVINDEFLAWNSRHAGRPFFAFLNYFDSHQPYIPVEPYASRFVRPTAAHYRPHLEHIKAQYVSQAEVSWMADTYDATIAYQDEELRQLLSELDRRGILQNTLVIVAADHGEHLGDHKRLGHMNSLYRQLLQVPLLMRLPGTVPAGAEVVNAVSLRDLPRTVLSIIGLPDSTSFPGMSLTRFFPGAPRDTTRTEDPILSEIATRNGRGPYSLVHDDYHYIAYHGQDKPSELYDMTDDPWETHDIDQEPQLADVLRSFHSIAEALMGKMAVIKRAPKGEDDDMEGVPQ